MSTSEKRNKCRNGAQPQNTSAIITGFGDMPQQANREASACCEAPQILQVYKHLPSLPSVF